MSVLSQGLLRKISDDSQSLSKRSNVTDTADDSFRKLLKVQSIDEESRNKDFFALVQEDEEDELEAKDLEAGIHPLIPSPPLMATLSPSETVAAASALRLNAALEAAFEKMASSMIVMSSSHEVETTLFLDNPHFASSSLFGTQITIREFSTAPKAFNIEIISNPQAIALMETAKCDLMAAFQNGKFNFSVNRFETHIEQNRDRPVLHRKESGDHSQNYQRGGRHP